MEKTVEILIGVPAAGKSTWIKNNRRPTSIVISSDDIITDLSSAQGLTYDQGFSKFIGKASSMVKGKYRDALASGAPHIIIDRTNLTPSSRSGWVNKAKTAGYKVIARVFPIPDEEELTRRLNSRPGKSIPGHVITDMKKNFSMPREEEGFDEIKMFDEGK